MKFVIEGGSQLNGEVKIQGSKNAAFPVIAACVLVRETCIVENVPEILDVKNFLAVLEDLGAAVEFANHRLSVNAKNIRNKDLGHEFMSKLRGSVLYAGALVARFGHARFAFPGGDAIGSRPIDAHLNGFRKLGVEVAEGADFIDITCKKLKGARITMGVPSVTGTENLILASVLTEGVTEIRLAATEPHVQDLCKFLNKMGAKIEGIGTPNLIITGVTALHGAQFALVSDEIATLTYCVAGAVTGGRVKVTGVNLKNLDAPLSVLERMKVNFETGASGDTEWVEIKEPVAGGYHATKIVTGVFPALLTDHQPLLGVLATQAKGQTTIHDWIYEGRQGYLRALVEMGAEVRFEDVHRSMITGPTPLHGAEIKTPDLRAGASILIAALVAKGRSVIYNAEIIDRGYEHFDENLRALGANIQRIE